MTGAERISDAELNALVDGELIAERRVKIEHWLLDEPEAGARVESWRRQNDILRAAFAKVAQEPLPPDLTGLLGAREATLRCVPSSPTPLVAGEAPIRQPQHRIGMIEAGRRQRLMGLTALAFLGGGLAVLAGASAVGMMGQGVGPAPISLSSARSPFAFSRRALEAQGSMAGRDDLRLDLDSADAAEISAFLTTWLRATIKLPDLGPDLRARGVRLTPGFAGLDGFVLYDSLASGRVGLLVGRAESPDMAIIQAREANGRGVSWFVAEGMGYALTGGMDRADMARLAARLNEAIRKP
ncbi:MAG: hypothetical protein Q7T73_21000 [Beijerinckiaceae bacterium]|nr:hypothetical protein [Beijerinckiaceae bacterium]